MISHVFLSCCVFCLFQDRVHGIAVSPDGQMVAVACDNRTVYVWDFESGDQLKALADHDWVRRIEWAEKCAGLCWLSVP